MISSNQFSKVSDTLSYAVLLRSLLDDVAMCLSKFNRSVKKAYMRRSLLASWCIVSLDCPCYIQVCEKK